MLGERDLRELLSYKAQHPVLSVYLNTDPAEGNADAYKLRLRTMLKDIELRSDADAVEHFVNQEYDWSGKSIAIFSCEPESYFRAFSLAVPIRDRIRISDQPHVKPLANLLDVYGGYGVALIDKQGARLFYFHLGELREQAGVMGEEVRKTKRGGSSQYHGRRGGVAGQTNYVEELADRNMKGAADYAARFFAENHVRRVLLGGTEDNLAQFRVHLPKIWQSLIVGTFPMSMTAGEPEVLERAMSIVREEDRRREVELVDTVITAAAKGKEGVIGLEETLGVARAGRVMTLLIAVGFRSPGYHCLGCGYVTVQELGRCPFCGSEMAKIHDAAEMAVRHVMQSGGEVEFVEHAPALEKAGNIAALLRY